MADILWFIIMAIFIAGLPYVYYKKGIRYCMGIGYILGVIISVRLFYENQGIGSVLASFVFSAQFFTFGVNPKELVEILQTLGSKLSLPYIICVWIEFLICPILSVSVILSYIKKGLDRTTLRTRLFKDIYIYSAKETKIHFRLQKIFFKKTKRQLQCFPIQMPLTQKIKCYAFLILLIILSD